MKLEVKDSAIQREIQSMLVEHYDLKRSQSAAVAQVLLADSQWLKRVERHLLTQIDRDVIADAVAGACSRAAVKRVLAGLDPERG